MKNNYQISLLGKALIFCGFILMSGLLIQTVESQDNSLPGTVVIDVNGFEMVYVPGDIFEIGIERDVFRRLLEQGLYPDIPSSQYDQIIDILDEQGVFDTAQVHVSSFLIDRYEVTIAQYAEVFEGCIDFGICTEIIITDNYTELNASPMQPQVGVTWFNALQFCLRRGMRLPTEYEWEWAARGPELPIFPWGNVFVPEYVVSIPDDTVTYDVGTIPENISWAGVYDLVGNAGEWVEDRPLPYSNEIESQFRQSILDTHRVVRGGSYTSNILFVNNVARETVDPRSGGGIGFRCAQSAQP